MFFPSEIWRKWNSDGHEQNQELQECLELLAFLNKNVIGWWRAKIRNSNNADNYYRFLMILMITMFVVPCHTSKYWSWRGPQQHFRMRHNGGHMSKWGGTENFDPGGGHSNILCAHKFQESGILSFAGDQWQKLHEEFWGIGGKTWGTLTHIEIPSLEPIVAGSSLGNKHPIRNTHFKV